jgi:hypothetical protein
MQQLLDKWERLRRSEYLRADEKLMLNHCISDLKRFTDHSVGADEMVGNRTAVEWLISQLQKSKDFQRVINEVNQSSTSVRDVLEQAKEMEKGQSHLYSAFCFKCINEKIPVIKFEDWINLQGGNK